MMDDLGYDWWNGGRINDKGSEQDLFIRYFFDAGVISKEVYGSICQLFDLWILPLYDMDWYMI